MTDSKELDATLDANPQIDRDRLKQFEEFRERIELIVGEITPDIVSMRLSVSLCQ